MSIKICPLTLEKLDIALRVWETTLGTDFELERQESPTACKMTRVFLRLTNFQKMALPGLTGNIPDLEYVRVFYTRTYSKSGSSSRWKR